MRLVAKMVRNVFGARIHELCRGWRDKMVYRYRCLAIKPRLWRYHRDACRLNQPLLTPNLETPKLIVSFTSYSARMRLKGVVEGTALSLLRQSQKADAVVLWLARSDFPNGEDDLPRGIVNLKRHGLTILFCEEMRSYKKLIPSLQKWPNATVITADDDVYYPPTWLEGLLTARKNHPSDVLAYVGRRIAIDHLGEIEPYQKWNQQEFCGTSVRNLPTGVGGILYPPGSWSERILNYQLAESLAKYGDDLFFHCCVVLNGSKITAVKPFARLLDLIPDAEAAPHLCMDNVEKNRNDEYVENILKMEHLYKSRLLSEL